MPCIRFKIMFTFILINTINNMIKHFFNIDNFKFLNNFNMFNKKMIKINTNHNIFILLKILFLKCFKFLKNQC